MPTPEVAEPVRTCRRNAKRSVAPDPTALHQVLEGRPGRRPSSLRLRSGPGQRSGAVKSDGLTRGADV